MVLSLPSLNSVDLWVEVLLDEAQTPIEVGVVLLMPLTDGFQDRGLEDFNLVYHVLFHFFGRELSGDFFLFEFFFQDLGHGSLTTLLQPLELIFVTFVSRRAGRLVA
mmetsp:Transcript_26699/g.25736  ORF Transcript_26699/g.25736 Transcript_26699/m.25736 type:complete len:107 (+) Transcript_26699:124-444(+)